MKGITDGCQYLRHSKVWGPTAIRRVRIREKTKIGEYMIADTMEALLSLAQLNVLELHTWNVDFDHDAERPIRYQPLHVISRWTCGAITGAASSV
jgi:DNA primase